MLSLPILMPIELAEKNMRLFAKEVMPALKEIDTTRITMQNAAMSHRASSDATRPVTSAFTGRTSRIGNIHSLNFQG